MMQSTTRRIVRERAALAVIDIQERLLPVMHEKDRVVRNSVRLIQAAAILNVPVLVTEQYRKGVGVTVPEVAAVIPGFAPVEKLAFSCCGAGGFVQSLRGKGVSDVSLCGIEAHVCVTQTCLDLLDEGFRPFVVTDAISSRTVENHQSGIARMRDAGAVIVSSEMILFELLGRAGTEEFKQILPLVK